MKDADELTAYYGALGALALGDREALRAVIDYSRSNWEEVVDITAEVLTPARSNEHGSWVFAAISQQSSGVQMAGLRLARYLAVKEHHVILRNYLLASDHTVKKEAINALRVIHGEEPLEELSVFEAIGHAQKWMKRI